MLLLYPGELYRLLGASSFTIAFSEAFLAPKAVSQQKNAFQEE
jgi:hypothetical protein